MKDPSKHAAHSAECAYMIESLENIVGLGVTGR